MYALSTTWSEWIRFSASGNFVINFKNKFVCMAKRWSLTHREFIEQYTDWVQLLNITDLSWNSNSFLNRKHNNRKDIGSFFVLLLNTILLCFWNIKLKLRPLFWVWREKTCFCLKPFVQRIVINLVKKWINIFYERSDSIYLCWL